MSFVVWLSGREAMVKLVPVAVVPCYSGRQVHYLPTEVVVPPIVPWVSCVNKQELWVVLMGVWYYKESISGEPSPGAPSGAAGACRSK